MKCLPSWRIFSKQNIFIYFEEVDVLDESVGVVVSEEDADRR